MFHRWIGNVILRVRERQAQSLDQGMKVLRRVVFHLQDRPYLPLILEVVENTERQKRGQT